MRCRLMTLLGCMLLAAAAIAACATSYGEADPIVDAGDAPDADVAPPVDADADADAAAASADAAFCTLNADADLCADFDEGKALDEGFTSTVGIVRLLADDASVSLPASVEVLGPVAYLAYAARARPPVTEQRLAFEVFIASPVNDAQSSAFIDLGGIFSGGTGCSYDFEYGETGTLLAIANRGVGADAAVVNQAFSLAFHPELYRWSHVELTLAQTGSGVTVAVQVDGASALPPTLTSCLSLGALPEVVIGMYFESDAVIRYDNVLFERH